MLKSMVIYFLTGGIVTTAIVLLEGSSRRLLSGLATLVPVFTLVAYFFIGQNQGGRAVGEHAWLVLIGTLVSWVPYMVVVAMLAAPLGPNKAIGIGLAVFFIFATVYLLLVQRFRWFL